MAAHPALELHAPPQLTLDAGALAGRERLDAPTQIAPHALALLRCRGAVALSHLAAKLHPLLGARIAPALATGRASGSTRTRSAITLRERGGRDQERGERGNEDGERAPHPER